MNIDKDSQIKAILEFSFFGGLGPLGVSRQEITKYVEENGLPKSAPKSGELSYEYKNSNWVITYYEKNINVGSNAFTTELAALEVILDHALPSYKRNNA